MSIEVGGSDGIGRVSNNGREAKMAGDSKRTAWVPCGDEDFYVDVEVDDTDQACVSGAELPKSGKLPQDRREAYPVVVNPGCHHGTTCDECPDMDICGDELPGAMPDKPLRCSWCDKVAEQQDIEVHIPNELVLCDEHLAILYALEREDRVAAGAASQPKKVVTTEYSLRKGAVKTQLSQQEKATLRRLNARVNYLPQYKPNDMRARAVAERRIDRLFK
jgi:hypothetical protein